MREGGQALPREPCWCRDPNLELRLKSTGKAVSGGPQPTPPSPAASPVSAELTPWRRCQARAMCRLPNRVGLRAHSQFCDRSFQVPGPGRLGAQRCPDSRRSIGPAVSGRCPARLSQPCRHAPLNAPSSERHSLVAPSESSPPRLPGPSEPRTPADREPQAPTGRTSYFP